MGTQEKITILEREDLGPVLARADHLENAIEVNGRAFYRLPPMVQEFILCHEVCHLRHHEWDEARTNELAKELFLSRASGDDDRKAREEFLAYLDGKDYSNFAWAALIPSVISLGTTVYGIIKDRNSGWYQWDRATQQSNLTVMLTQAFEQSRKTSRHSAEEYLWQQLGQYTHKDDSLDQFLSRSDNSWVQNHIRKYEQKYGHKIGEVTPIDITAFPWAIVAAGAVIGFAIYMIIKKSKK